MSARVFLWGKVYYKKICTGRLRADDTHIIIFLSISSNCLPPNKAREEERVDSLLTKEISANHSHNSYTRSRDLLFPIANIGLFV